jgi:hypothetical protein
MTEPHRNRAPFTGSSLIITVYRNGWLHVQASYHPAFTAELTANVPPVDKIWHAERKVWTEFFASLVYWDITEASARIAGPGS